jgi:hypothetical protein
VGGVDKTTATRRRGLLESFADQSFLRQITPLYSLALDPMGRILNDADHPWSPCLSLGLCCAVLRSLELKLFLALRCVANFLTTGLTTDDF